MDKRPRWIKLVKGPPHEKTKQKKVPPKMQNRDILEISWEKDDKFTCEKKGETDCGEAVKMATQVENWPRIDLKRWGRRTKKLKKP